MNPDLIAELRETLWRRELTPAEQRSLAAYLSAHPAVVADWEVEMALARGARRLRPIPVPSNFTARVLAEVRREAGGVRAGGRWGGWTAWLGARWVPAAGAALVVATLALSTWQIERGRRQADYASQVTALRALAEFPPTVLEDFEAIHRFAESTSPVDFGLLAALEP